MKKNIIIFVIISIMSLCFAQTKQSLPTANNASAYHYSGTITGSEQLKIYTYIWGQVKKTGLYIVPDNTDLLTLISLAGGPTEDAKLSKIRIIRPTSEGEKIIYVDLEKYIKTGNEKLIPILKPGDTIIVAGSVYYAFYRTTDFLSKIAIVLSVLVSLKNL